MTDFWPTAARHLRGEFARVVSNDGQVFHGWVETIDPEYRHVLLRDAELVGDGASGDRGTVVVAHADSIEQVSHDPGEIRQVPLDVVYPAPWHAREFDADDERLYVDEVERMGWVDSYPVVRPIVDATGQTTGFEIVEGHKRLWAAGQAGLVEHPVEVVGLDDVAAARRFVRDHLPAPRHLEEVDERHENWYDDDAIADAIAALVDELGEAALQFDRVVDNAERLELDLDVAADDGGEEA